MVTSILIMKLVLILATLVLLSEAQDVVCKSGRTRKKISIGAGDSFSFKTQAGGSYAPNTKCMATYERKKASCPTITFSCSEFDINNKDASCKKKDQMIVQEKGKAKKSYCQTTGPDITTSAATLKVLFISDKKRQSSGAVCTVQCFDGTTTATTPSTTATGSTNPPTTTTTGSGRLPSALSLLSGYPGDKMFTVKSRISSTMFVYFYTGRGCAKINHNMFVSALPPNGFFKYGDTMFSCTLYKIHAKAINNPSISCEYKAKDESNCKTNKYEIQHSDKLSFCQIICAEE